MLGIFVIVFSIDEEALSSENAYILKNRYLEYKIIIIKIGMLNV